MRKTVHCASEIVSRRSRARARTLGPVSDQRERLRRLVERLPAAVAVVEGKDHVYTLSNPENDRLLGRPAPIGQSARAMLPASPEMIAMLDTVYLTGQGFSGREFPVKTLDEHGAVRDIFINGAYEPIFDDEGQVEGVLAFAYDVTEHVRAREQAERAVQLREEFLSIASHELRTPLTSLSLHVEALLRAAEHTEDEALRMRGVRVRAQLARLAHLVDELLDASRITGGHLPIAPSDMDLVELVDEVIGRLDMQARVVHSTITREGAESARGLWDRARLDQVLTNLLANALRYAPRTPVRVYVERAGDHVVLLVRDEGPGIAPEHHARIFERFERMSDRGGGLGLGLWISRSIVEAHGGTIAIDSAKGGGATFRVELPV